MGFGFSRAALAQKKSVVSLIVYIGDFETIASAVEVGVGVMLAKMASQLGGTGRQAGGVEGTGHFALHANVSFGANADAVVVPLKAAVEVEAATGDVEGDIVARDGVAHGPWRLGGEDMGLVENQSVSFPQGRQTGGEYLG